MVKMAKIIEKTVMVYKCVFKLVADKLIITIQSFSKVNIGNNMAPILSHYKIQSINQLMNDIVQLPQ